MKHTLSRRRFCSLAATAAAAVACRASLGAADAPAAAPAQAGYTFCAFEKPLQFLSYDEMAKVFAAAGYQGIEAAVRPGGHVLPEKVEEDLPRMVEALKAHGLEITILTSGINRASPPLTEKVLRTAVKLGIKRYRMLWYEYDLAKPVRAQLDNLRPQVRELAALNRQLGISALYQNHAGERMVGGPLWDIYELIQDLDPKDIGLAYDIRHAMIEGGLSWPIQFHLVKSHLQAVFVKDARWENGKVANVPLGQGMVGPRFVDMLKASGFRGPVSVHVEYLGKSKDARQIGDAFRQDLQTLRGWLGAA